MTRLLTGVGLSGTEARPGEALNYIGVVTEARIELRSGQLPAANGFAESSATLVADNAAEKLIKIGAKRDATLQVRVLSTGRGGGYAKFACGILDRIAPREQLNLPDSLSCFPLVRLVI